jgi:hypothetical protein
MKMIVSFPLFKHCPKEVGWGIFPTEKSTMFTTFYRVIEKECRDYKKLSLKSD